MKTIKIRIGDKVKLFNGTFGNVSNINYSTYEIEISGEHKIPEWFHIVNVKYLNDINCESTFELDL